MKVSGFLGFLGFSELNGEEELILGLDGDWRSFNAVRGGNKFAPFDGSTGISSQVPFEP